MSRVAVVLRPMPGNESTAARLRAAGLDVCPLPMFGERPMSWEPPAIRGIDALLLTSARAARLAGPLPADLAALPVVAVGSSTAAAARGAGLAVAVTGASDAAGAVGLAKEAGFHRLLHLAGREHRLLPDEVVATRIVYALDVLPVATDVLARCRDRVVLLHSPRAADRFALLLDQAGVDRATVRLAALSDAVRDAAGGGWAAALASPVPTDAALVALAVRLAD